MISKLLILNLLLVFTSCNSTKEKVQAENSPIINSKQSDYKTMDAEMINNGFKIGEIKYLKDKECAYIIIDEASNAKFDPVNISDELYQSYKQDNQKIYFKYRPLRMMNRCTEANPISLIDIKKREG